MITKKQLGIALKEKVAQRVSQIQIGEWAYEVYWENIQGDHDEIDEILLRLNTLELGYQFQPGYEILDKLADDLIAEKDVEMW